MSQTSMIFASDLHLSHNPPAFRNVKDVDWYDAMEYSLLQLKELQEANDKCPVVIAGDVFDKWNSPPKLIRFAMEKLPPNTYAIPGQHDLPQHRLEAMPDSAYGVLVSAGAIQHLRSRILLPHGYQPVRLGPVTLYPFQWGEDIPHLAKTHPKTTNIAVCHRYVWAENHHYPGVSSDKLITNIANLDQFHYAVFGDNHKGFMHYLPAPNGKDTCVVFNCGTFMIRKRDEVDYAPRVGLLTGAGTNFASMRSVPLDTSEDKYNHQHTYSIGGEDIPVEISDLIPDDILKQEATREGFIERLQGILSGQIPLQVRVSLSGLLEEVDNDDLP